MAPSKTQRARRAEFARYKEDVKREGKPFFPYAMLHDTIMSLVVVRRDHRARVHLVLHGRRHRGGRGPRAGILGPWYAEKADPGTTSFVPRPDWFFYFLFYLLRIFKWPNTVVLGTVGIPTILLVLLLGLPFYDRSRERRPLRRPVAMIAAIIAVLSMGVLTWKGATAEEALGSELIAQGLPREWAEEQGFAGNRAGRSRRDAVRPVGLPQLPHVQRDGQRRRSGRRTSPTSATSDRGIEGFKAYLSNPAQVRQQGDGLVRLPRRGEPHRPRHVPRRLQRRRGREVTRLPGRACARPRALAAARSRRRGYAPAREGVPRCHGCVRRSLRGRDPAARSSPRVARSACARRRRGSRCSPPSCTATPRCRATRCSPVRRRSREGHVTVTRPTTGAARTQAARRRSTPTSSAPARCRPSARSPPARWRTSSTGLRRSRSRSGAGSCSCRARRRSRRSTCAGSRRCTRQAP